jgi:hypothetical protein
MTPTGYKPRTSHLTVDTIVPNLNSNVTPKPRLWIHKDGSRVLLGFPNQSSPKLSQDFEISQQSKYPSLFYPACTTWENGPPPFSATQSLRQLFSLFGLQCNWSRISMLELLRLAVVINAGHRPMHLRYAGLKSRLDHTNNHYNQLSCG